MALKQMVHSQLPKQWVITFEMSAVENLPWVQMFVLFCFAQALKLFIKYLI